MEQTQQARTYRDVITPEMAHGTAVFHMTAYINVRLLRRDRTLRTAAIQSHIDRLAQTAIDDEQLPTADELDTLAETIATLETDDPTRSRTGGRP